VNLVYRLHVRARIGTRTIAESTECCEDGDDRPARAAEMVRAIMDPRDKDGHPLAAPPPYATIEWSAAELSRRESDAYLLGTGRQLQNRRVYEYGGTQR